MTRGLWLIFAALALIAATVLFRFQPEKLAQAAPADAEPLPDVLVQHEYVSVTVPAAASPVRIRATPGSRSGIRALDDAVVDAEPAPMVKGQTVKRASREQTLFEKARRAFVGDGRHRPEPFPRPGGNN